MNLSRFNQAVEMGAGYGIGKQPVAPTDDEGAYGPLGGIVVDVEPTVLAIPDQLVPLVVEIAQRLTGQTGGRHLGSDVSSQALISSSNGMACCCRR